MYSTMLLEKVSARGKLYGIFSETIEKYSLLKNVTKLIFLFSGGKDATLGLYFLNQYILKQNLNIELVAVMVKYPKHVYILDDGTDADCFTKTLDFWKKQNVNIKVFEPDCNDIDGSEANACKICKSARKKIVDSFLDENSNATVVTGYTLYDALAYIDEMCLTTNYSLNLSEIRDKKTVNRIQNCLHKIKAKEELPNGISIIRPLICMHENQIMEFVKENNIPFIDRLCKASENKHKREYFRVLNVAKPINNTSYEGVLSFLSHMNLDLPNTFDDIDCGNYFTDC